MFKFNLKKLALLATIGCILTVNNTYSKNTINECSLRNIASTFWIKPSLSPEPEYDLVETRLSNQELFILNNNYDNIFKPQIQTAINLIEQALCNTLGYKTLNIKITTNDVVIIQDILTTFLHKKLLSEYDNDFYYNGYFQKQFSFNNNDSFFTEFIKLNKKIKPNENFDYLTKTLLLHDKLDNAKSKLAKYSSSNSDLYKIAEFIFFDLKISK